MNNNTYPARFIQIHDDGDISFNIYLGFGVIHNQRSSLANIKIIDWDRYRDLVEEQLDWKNVKNVLIRSRKAEEGYPVDVTYQNLEDDSWYNLALVLVDAGIAARSN